MIGGRGPIPCKFGVQCHRQDCWYSHPEGRMIDSARRNNNGNSNGAHRAAPPSALGGVGHPVGARGGMSPGGMGGPPQASPRMGGGGGSGGGGGGNECRYGYECKRRDCHFNHPFGRAIDADGGGSSGAGGGRPVLHRPPSNSSVGSVTRGMSELSFGSYPPANATDDDQDLRDTWFPKARECTCCKGYVYGCTSDICESMGQCTCSIEEKDLDGSGSVSSNSVSRTSSPQVGMAANGNSHFGGMGVEGMRPPHPPSEAALAGAGGGGGRPGPNRSTECRYGMGCKRADCSFSHPQGRDMDGDGVSFGDFGMGGAGGKSSGSSRGRRAGGKPTIDQDLMDTWYPDCRECDCCKGYKHGCKTPACADAGLCACSWGGGPAAPIARVGSTPSTEFGSGSGSGSASEPASTGPEKPSAVEAAGVAAGQGGATPPTSSVSAPEATAGAVSAT